MTTRPRDAPRDEKRDASPEGTRRANQTRRASTARRPGTTARHAAREERTRLDEQARPATPARRTWGNEQRDAIRDEGTRSGRRRRAKDEGKHTATPQDKRMTPPPRRDADEQNHKTRHTPRANTATTIRHETLHETVRRDEEREAREHQMAMSKKSHSAPFSPAHTRMRQGRMGRRRPPSAAR